MLIRFRLRSSSSSNSTTSSISERSMAIDSSCSPSSLSSTSTSCMDRDQLLGECYLCGQQDDNEGRRQLLTCSVCATQFHLKCLDLKSKQFCDTKSRAYKTWVCRKCRRCLWCREKRTKINPNPLVSSLRSHPERKLNSMEMISCIECDSSIHLVCFFRQQNDRHQLPPLSIRELRKRRKNFICPQCTGDEPDVDEEIVEDEEEEEDDDELAEDEEIEDSSDENDNGDEEESSHNESDDDDSDNSQQKITKHQILQTQLRNLGIDNPDKFIETIQNEQNHRTSISTRSSRRTFQSPMIMEKSGQINKMIDTTDEKNDEQCQNQSQQQKNRKRKKSESEHQPPQCSPKKIKCVSPSPPILSNEQETLQSLSAQHFHQEPCGCSVSGCDSNGHLSGIYDHHSTIETCPLFHNQTADDCRQRYRRRIECQRQIQEQQQQRKCWSSPRKSIQRIGLLQQKNVKWNQIMNQRNVELKSLQLETKPTFTSSRQPNLEGLTPKFDLNLFIDAQARTAQMIHENSALELATTTATKMANDSNEIKTSEQNFDENQEIQQQKKKPGIETIIFGKHEISVWYNSQYSDEFQNCLRLYICEFCLKCMNSSIILDRHMEKCTLKHPPGNEIYRKGKISFFEVDGNKQKEYCQNLCLLAKLFLEYKTLFVDVEPFLFYVMTENDHTNGIHLLGYFSKEKHSPNSYNVSCILTLPQYQRSGYGRMLIDFSYLLTRNENKIGSPEKPLSDHGIISYRSYWKFVIMDFLSSYVGKDILLKDISQHTGINSVDLISTLQLMGILKYWKGKHLILVNDEQRKRYGQEIKRKRKLFGDKMIDPKCLRWTPSIYPR
nr:histone acetyltransferase KAT7-like [Dermatophagoides farinae]